MNRLEQMRTEYIGMRFDRLSVVDVLIVKGHETKLVCRCDCGEMRNVRPCALKNGNHRSCGCLRRDRVIARNYIHGQSLSPTHISWLRMLQRCSDPGAHAYHRYGGRGIKVCEEWRGSFVTFLRDMGERPEGRTLDRINIDGNYEPSNCRWATRLEQARNKSKPVASVEFDVPLDFSHPLRRAA
jgi:hypothetical protein